MDKREARRDRSWRYGARARRVHLKLVHPNGVVDCVCDQSVWYFRKRKALGCPCRRRKKGAPKLGTGICHGGEYRPPVRERIQGRRLTRAWLAIDNGEP